MVQTESTDLNQQLCHLIATACSYPRRSLQRRQHLHRFTQCLLKSGRLWQEYSPEYEDALQDTLLQVCKHPENYDAERAGVITWVNTLLKFKLLDYKRKRIKEQQHQLLKPAATDPIEQLPAAPEIPPMLAETYDWIKADSSGKLRSLHLRGCPNVNCQTLLLRRFPPEQSWDDIAAEFGVPRSSPAMFYKRCCLRCLRQFGYQQGYLKHP